MSVVLHKVTVDDIHMAVLRDALSPENMYFTHLALKAIGENRQPTADEAMIHYLHHGGYEKTLRSLDIKEYPLTSNTPPQHRAEPVHSD